MNEDELYVETLVVESEKPVWVGYCVECDKDIYLRQMQAKHPEITEANYKDAYDCPFCEALLIPF